jgi:transcriptional regulator with XRE-family HTH domain
MSIIVASPTQLKKQIGLLAKERRLKKNLSRKTLAEKSLVSASSIKRFETTGNISLESLLNIALVLDCLDAFSQLFTENSPVSLYKKTVIRQRGRT